MYKKLCERSVRDFNRKKHVYTALMLFKFYIFIFHVFKDRFYPQCC